MKHAPPWFPKWTGAACVIVASGPSAKSVNLKAGQGRARYIVTNNSVTLAPWADVLYACDANWWIENNGAPHFAGVKVSQDRRARQLFRDIKGVTSVRGVDVLLFDQGGVIGWGGNSGFQALNLAAQTGVTKIILVGFDMTLRHGSHWHGDHKGLCTNPTSPNVERWRRVTDATAPDLKKRGIRVFNCSPQSALTQFPKCSFEAALDA